MKKVIILNVSYRFLGELIGGILARKEGARQVEEGEKKISQAEGMIPGQEDPELRYNLSRIQRKRDSMYSGSYASSMKDNLDQTFANIKEGALTLASGGGADVNALLKAGGTVSQAYNDILGNIENRAFQYETMSQKQLDDIAQRKLELSLLRHQEKRYDGVSEVAAGRANLAAGTASIAGGVDGAINTVIGGMTAGLYRNKNQ